MLPFYHWNKTLVLADMSSLPYPVDQCSYCEQYSVTVLLSFVYILLGMLKINRLTD